MRCPYCVSEIDDAALACPHCTRDLYLFKPLLQRIAELELRVATLEGSGVAATVAGDEEKALPLVLEPEHPSFPDAQEWLTRVGLPLLLLLLAHLLITVVYDANTLYLRVVSLLIPLPFGFLLATSAARHRGVLLAATLAVSLASVFGMSAITALVDSVPLFPENLREWREFLEYSASIGFSYVTGVVLGGMSRHRGRVAREREGMSVALARLVSSGAENTLRFHGIVKKFNDFGGALTAAATTATSIYMGLQGFVK